MQKALPLQRFCLQPAVLLKLLLFVAFVCRHVCISVFATNHTRDTGTPMHPSSSLGRIYRLGKGLQVNITLLVLFKNVYVWECCVPKGQCEVSFIRTDYDIKFCFWVLIHITTTRGTQEYVLFIYWLIYLWIERFHADTVYVSKVSKDTGFQYMPNVEINLKSTQISRSFHYFHQLLDPVPNLFHVSMLHTK